MTPRLLPLVALISLAATSLVRADSPNILTEAEKAAGWKLLFDGKTTAGWVALGKTEFPSTGWTAEDGLLKHTKGGGDIVTAEPYRDFEMTWEWNIAPVGNSGVKYNLPDPNKNIGFEYQLLDDERHPDGIKGGRLHQAGGLYDLIEPPADKKVNPPGEWNSSRLVVNGNHVEQWLNGAKTVEFEIGSDDLKERIAKSKYAKVPNFGEKTASPILLQDHGDPISFRSIKLRVLPAK
ncbi:MAG TPA: DUF1080 domain-containing protein [Chthoniobacteraceae bacterium]|nr:DUF1080 domain-containing protein [Chthoniobacteraceae bacterium]